MFQTCHGNEQYAVCDTKIEGIAAHNLFRVGRFVCPPQYIFMAKIERSSIAEVDFIILETMYLVTLFLSVLFVNGNWSLTRPELYCLQLQNKTPLAQDGYKLLYFLYREK